MTKSSFLPSRIAVFCGSSPGNQPHYAETTRALGRELARRKIEIVFGGCCVGLMGLLADSALASGGRVIGVIPRDHWDREATHQGLTELHEVATMHERKALMAHLSEAFVVLPGGFGTFDETIEMVTWNQLGIHRKPVGVLDVDGFFDPLFQQIERAVTDGFIYDESMLGLFRAADIDGLFNAMFPVRDSIDAA